MTGSVAHRQTARGGMIATGLAIAGIGGAGFAAAVLAVLFTVVSSSGGCGASGAAGGVGGVGGGGIVLGPPGTGERVGATEYGGPGDPSSGITGARGDNLLAHPDTYAELGGLSWQTATTMGGLPKASGKAPSPTTA